MKFNFRKVGIAALAACPSLALAAPSSTSPYMTDAQSSYVQDQTSKGIEQVNMISCLMGAMKPSALVNQGDYLALVDESKCSSSRDSANNSGSSNAGSNAAQYVTATLNSSRASNNDPMLVKTWVDENDGGNAVTIYVHTSAYESPTTSNPYGRFRLDYCGKMVGVNSCVMNGFIDANSSGLAYYETEIGGGGGGGPRNIAMTLNASGTTTGSGRMSMLEGGVSTDFTFAYNDQYFRRSDGTADQCFSRDAADAGTGFSVWRYGLYDAATGARVTRNSGFPIEYTNGGTTYHGYIGYWGLSLPSDAVATMTNGSTVQKVDYSSGSASATSYTMFKAGGKLTKYTKGTKTLAEIDQIRFTFWASSSNSPGSMTPAYQQNTSYEAYWDNTNHQFVITGYQSCGSNGCNMANLASPLATTNNYWSTNYGFGISGWSQALGGEVFIATGNVNFGTDATQVPVTYRTQDLVYPSQFASIGDLYCITDCPTAAGIASLVANTAQNPFGSTAGNWNATAAGSLVQYTLNATTGNLVDPASAAVVATDPLSGMFQWGVRSGKLFPVSQAAAVDAADGAANNSYRAQSIDALNVYYIWETGSNPWNQFAAVKDSGNNFVTFDPPLQVSFSVPSGAAYGSYAGQTILLQYNGFGELFGIPGKCVSPATNLPVSCDTQNARYVPEFMIPFDQTVGVVANGSTTYLVKWLDREIRLAKKNLSVCTNAGLSLPAGIGLPTSADLKDPSNPGSDVYIGAKPSVTAAPRVIHGEVMY